MLEQLVQMLGGHSLHIGYGFVFGTLLLCGFGLPLPEDVVLVTGGVLAWLEASQRLGVETASFSIMVRDPALLAMVLFGLAGILAGDSVIFFAGRKFGVRLADFRPLRRLITPAKLEKVEKLMRRRGNIVVVIARYLPGIRAPTYFTAGHAGLPYWEFLVFDGAAALVSAPLWVCIGFYFGSNIEEAARFAARFGHYILVTMAVVLLGIGLRWLQARRAAANAPPAPQSERD
ncbi:DedA family protein [Anaeromyxobacter oryzae]|uniref:Membrane protein n=1 Tax=Anaeromyxobacter oryzae TaxID=2918170 RepID=A0ABM7WQ31_9BACT|nr:DedA family protein [Anaeromyxobacter oryzae]BDG01573.1 membrane protein [Anaeromyxobacter oryzae]